MLDKDRKNLFSRLKTKMRQETGRDLGGRFMSIVLEQVIAENPRVLRRIFPGIALPRRCVVHLEDPYIPSAEDGKRRSDVAVYDGEKLVAVAEVKEEDHNSEGNPEQIRRYGAFLAGRHGVHFAYITKHPPPESVITELARMPLPRSRVHQVLYRELHDALSRDMSYVTRQFCQFVKESGVIYQPKIDKQALMLLMAQSVWTGQRRGVGKIVANNRVEKLPELLTDLIGNISVMTADFYSSRRSLFKSRFRHRFELEPYIDLREAKKYKPKRDAEDRTFMKLPEEMSIGGYLNVGGIAWLAGTDWMGIWIGYSFDLDVHDGHLQWPRGAIQVRVESDKWNLESDRAEFSELPSQRRAHGIICKLARTAVRRALQTKTMASEKRRALVTLDRNLRQ